jgi:DNA processing protein
VSTSISVVDSATRKSTLQWLALTLTPGLGPTRAHRLVEHFGTVAAVFRASLTELEATGLLAVSAQSLGTGRSLELAQEEAARAAAAGVHLGSGMAERLSIDLATRGLVIQSGMARGVDTAAHRGAINAKGKTIAVFGTGVDVPYPKENTRLSEQIIALGGSLISEFPLGTFAHRRTFRSATASSAACRWACWSLKLRNTAALASQPAAH